MSVALVRQPKFRKLQTFLPRFLSALFLIPLSLWMIYKGPPYSLVFGGMIALGLFFEWGNLCLKNSLPFWSKLCVIVLGTVYLIVAVLWLFALLSQPAGWQLCYWLLFLVWSTDTAAYGVGKLLKGPKLAPSISPGKTWSGFIGGMIGGIGFAYISSFWLVLQRFTFWEIAFLVFIAQGGDLLESKAKRWSHLKDSGFLIPGHGGFLDRLDSLLAVAFTLAFGQSFF